MLSDVIKRLQYLEHSIEQAAHEAQRIQEAMQHAQSVGVWTDCMMEAFESELAAVNRRLKNARAQFIRLSAVEVDTELLERAYKLP